VGLVISPRHAYSIVVRDAYLRVVAQELVDGDLQTASGLTPALAARTAAGRTAPTLGMTPSGAEQTESPAPPVGSTGDCAGRRTRDRQTTIRADPRHC